MGTACLVLWPLTSVGDNKDDVLVKGLGAGQSHLSTKLFHHIQGHLWMGEVRGWTSQVTSALSPPFSHTIQETKHALRTLLGGVWAKEKTSEIVTLLVQDNWNRGAFAEDVLSPK